MERVILRSQNRGIRLGFTLIELIVCLAIVGLLAALLTVGVQQSREASRRIACVNNLKQCGLGIQDYVESRGTYPVNFGNEWQSRLYRQFGFPLPPSKIVPRDFVGFRCPDNGSYVANDGTRFRGSPVYRNGFSGGVQARRPADIVDGQSATAAVSEQCGRDRWWIDRRIDSEPGREAELTDACRNHRVSVFPKADGTNVTGYDHFLNPNAPGCWNTDAPYDGFQFQGIFPASSNHPGGVNVLYVDGHVGLVSDTVDGNTWQAMGTINGGETIGFF